MLQDFLCVLEINSCDAASMGARGNRKFGREGFKGLAVYRKQPAKKCMRDVFMFLIWQYSQTFHMGEVKFQH